MHIVLFDPRRIALQEELKNHPELCKLIANHPADQFEHRLAEIAAYCDVLLDDYYTQDELSNLCELLTSRLVDKRTQYLLLN